MKQIRSILFGMALVAYLVVVSGFISAIDRSRKITKVEIHIADSARNPFIRAADVSKMIAATNPALHGATLQSVDIRKIEASLLSRQIVRKAEVYYTLPGILHIDIRQKSPFVRITNAMGQTYYLDREGNIIPASINYSPYVLVVNGFINEPFAVGRTMNILDVPHDSLSHSKSTIYEAFELAHFIASSTFWNAQIEQVYVTRNHEFELIPRVGAHIIEIGRADNLGEKFENLRLLYTQGLNNLGWNAYERISLKYKNQVVCTKIQ